MQKNLFYGGEIKASKKKSKHPSWNWVSTKLVREHGPYYGVSVKSPQDVVNTINDHMDLENCDKEHFIAMYLDRKGNINAISIISIGGLSSTQAHPREVFKPALECSAASVIFVHNHPSGDPTPSAEDKNLTDRLVKAGGILGIEALDHIVVGVDKYYSFKERGLI